MIKRTHEGISFMILESKGFPKPGMKDTKEKISLLYC